MIIYYGWTVQTQSALRGDYKTSRRYKNGDGFNEIDNSKILSEISELSKIQFFKNTVVRPQLLLVMKVKISIAQNQPVKQTSL